MVILEFEWGIQGWLWGVWVGYGRAAPPALRVLVCTRIRLPASGGFDRQLVYASCPWAVDGQRLVLVSPVIFGCRWCNLSAVGLGALELTWNVSNVVVSGLVLMLDCP